MEEETRFLSSPLCLDSPSLGFLLRQPGIPDVGRRAQPAEQTELRNLLPCLYGISFHITDLPD